MVWDRCIMIHFSVDCLLESLGSHNLSILTTPLLSRVASSACDPDRKVLQGTGRYLFFSSHLLLHYINILADCPTCVFFFFLKSMNKSTNHSLVIFCFLASLECLLSESCVIMVLLMEMGHCFFISWAFMPVASTKGSPQVQPLKAESNYNETHRSPVSPSCSQHAGKAFVRGR